MGQNNTKWDKIQTIVTLVSAAFLIGGIILNFGEAKNKLENLEIGQTNIKIFIDNNLFLLRICLAEHTTLIC